MKIGLITIGSELLNGTRLDTNSTWIGKNVLYFGGKISWHMAVNDDSKSIKSAIESTPDDIEALLLTGGLGPTHDDITQKVLYDYFGAKTLFDEDYWNVLRKKFEKKGKTIPDSNRNQAYMPDIGDVIPNPLGSARGLHFKSNQFHLFAMPGVPAEMKKIMNDTILPWINDKSNSKSNVVILRTTGIAESLLYERLSPIIERYPNVKVAFLPSYTGVDLRISSDSKSSFSTFTSAIKPVVKNYYYGDEKFELEDAVGELLRKFSMTVATGESCSGGLIGDRLTNVSGSSSFYKGSIVAYSNSVKTKLLNVNQMTLDTFGAVSEQTALEMAKGAFKTMDADIGLSTTGIAGPNGGTNIKPVGLVYVGIFTNKFNKVYQFNFSQERKINKIMTSQAALNILRYYLLNEI